MKILLGAVLGAILTVISSFMLSRMSWMSDSIAVILIVGGAVAGGVVGKNSTKN